MELRDYLTILKKNLPIIFLFALSGGMVALMFASKITQGSRLEQLFYIPAIQEQTPGSRYEGYWAQEKARNFTDTAVAVLASPDFAFEAATGARITARKVAPQLVKVTVSVSDPQSAQAAIEKTVGAFNRKMASLAGSETLQIKAVGSTGQTVSSGPTKPLAVIFGILAGSTFALLVVGLKNYFKV